MLYFIALIPPSSVAKDVLKMKEDIRDRFGSARALRSPAHITLFPPFQFAEKELFSLEEVLKKFCELHTPFEIDLLNFNCFAPRVIYVDVIPNQLLMNFQSALEEQMESHFELINNRYNQAFHPHMTIGFKDLKKDAFRKAWEEYQSKSYQASFKVSQLSLLKHQGHHWEVFQEFDLKGFDS